ncbi:MAG: ATP synthase F1 subunit gamma [Alphaproteobacteria bacterium]
MPSLKTLRTRIQSVKATQKITSAMRVVASSRLRRAQGKVETIRPFARGLGKMVTRVMAHNANAYDGEAKPARLLILATSDRGLCGAFNINLAKDARAVLSSWAEVGIPFYIACFGRKGRDLLKREFQDKIILEAVTSEKGIITWEDTHSLSQRVAELIQEHQIGGVEAVYCRFRSVLVQTITRQQLVPYEVLEVESHDHLCYDILEPSRSELLDNILPANLAAQLYRILCESAASEHGARVTAMDHATRNAHDMIDKLQLHYNRTRQGLITRELIEVIAGAEAI